MTKYILDATSLSSFSKNEPKQIIVLCHGYGGDGQDISTLATNWQRFLPEAFFYVQMLRKFALLIHKAINGLIIHQKKKR